MIDEFSQFSSFCEREFNIVPTPAAIELGKIDHFVHRREWSSRTDLAEMLPTLSAFLHMTETDDPSILMRFDEGHEGQSLQVSLSTAVTSEGNEKTRLLRLETTVVRPCGPQQDEIESAFANANLQANAVFMTLTPKEQRDQRFQSQES